MWRRLGSVLANLSLLGIAVVAALGAVELYLRWTGTFEVAATAGCYVFSDNPRLMYEPAPHCEGTNALGMRDHEVALAAGARPVVAIGDSITFGPGVDVDETWPKQLERLMRQAGRDTPVVSLAVQGYSTVQEVETLRLKGLPLRPRVVLLQYCFNDEEIYTTIFDGLVADMRRERTEGVLGALDPRHGALVRRLMLTRTAVLVRVALAHLRPGTDSQPADGILSYYREHSPVRDGLTALDELARRHALDVLVLIFPHAYGAHADRTGGFALPELSEFPKAWVFDNVKVLALCRELGFTCIDIAERFAADPMLRRIPGHRIFRDGCCHLTPLGHKTMAWVVFREMASRGLVRRS
jgi:hypothetical protein